MVSLRRPSSRPLNFVCLLRTSTPSPHAMLAMLVGLFCAGVAVDSFLRSKTKEHRRFSPFEGGPPLGCAKAIENALKKDTMIVPESKWNASAKKLNVTATARRRRDGRQ